jgi:two-component system, NtrC family, response regulator HydG
MDITLPEGDLDRLLGHPLVSALLATASDGVVVVDAESRLIKAMNPRARELLGYDADEVLGCGCSQTLNSPSCYHRCPLTEVLQGRPENSDLDLYYRGQDGDRVLHARTRMIVVRAPDGRPLAGIELFQDLSEHHALKRALNKRGSLQGIIGASTPMQTLYELVEQIAPYELPVLITGESGVGKERFADAVQHLSARAGKPYVKVNCAALNPSLIESELFGHKRGAFTGATNDRRGSFEEADGGTLLLDEVGELPLGLQAKLLRAIQQGEVQRVGEDRPRFVDVRVIAATNRDIEEDVSAGHFREDLYYRLAGVRVHVPPLRERAEDIPDLVEHFLERFQAEAKERGRPKPVRGLSDDALRALMDLPWRGNVRELENVLRLAWIRSPTGGRIGPEHITQPNAGPRRANAPSTNLAELEQQAIRRAMDSSEGNMSAAARMLGIDRSTLWRKLKKDG